MCTVGWHHIGAFIFMVSIIIMQWVLLNTRNNLLFCAGMVFVYTILQTAIWWLFHTTALLWKIRYPFHARTFQMSHKIRYVSAVCIIVGLLVPLVPIIASMADYAADLRTNTDLQRRNVTFLSGGLGYRQIRFPPILCSGGNNNVVYYTSILPINLIVIVGLTELIILFWTIYRVCCIV